MECTLDLTGVTDLQTLVVNLEGAHDSKNYMNVTVPVTIFVGDVTGNLTINASDVTQVKNQVGTTLSTSNCRNDVNRSGGINAGDVTLVKTKVGTSFNYVPSLSLPRLEVCVDDPRYLCKSGGLGKFFWLADTCWWLMNAEDKDVLYYLKKRAEQGFNGIQIMGLMLELRGGFIPPPPETQLHCKTDFYGFSPVNTNGDPDPTCENSAYWSRFKWLVEQAERLGLYVCVFPVHGGEIPSYFGSDDTKAYNYAKALATLLQNHTNVWYSVSVEYDAINNFNYQTISPAQFNMFKRLADGLSDGSTSNIIRGIHRSLPWSSVVQFAPNGEGGCGGTSGINCAPTPVTWLDFHMLQSSHKSTRGTLGTVFYKQTDELIDQGYWISSPKPIFDAEAMYENIVDGVWHDQTVGPNSPRATASHVRFKAYEAVFAGACGHTYGNENTAEMWSLGTPANPNRPWTQAIYRKNALDAVPSAHGEGATQMKFLKELMECRSANRIQDQAMIGETPYPSLPSSQYEAVYGGLRHKRATRNSAGTWVLVYLPQGANDDPAHPEYREVTIDATNLANQGLNWTAKWFTPETGSSENGGWDSHTGNSYTFRTPATRSGTDPVKDYVLIWQSPTFTACDPEP